MKKVVISLMLLSLAAGCGRKPTVLEDDCAGLRAGGTDSCALVLRFAPRRPPAKWRVKITDEKKRHSDCLAAEPEGDSLEIRAGVEPCSARVEVRSGKRRFVRRVVVERNYSDSDRDGFPDVDELTGEEDRAAFRAWFTRIALSQLDAVSDWWKPENRDCAGLVRFAYREALRRHGRRARLRYPGVGSSPPPDVRKYNYPATPLLGDRVFRTKDGPFLAADLKDATFSGFAQAKVLQQYNTERISRDIRDALPGDLLFYFHMDDVQMPYHTMIFIGPERAADPTLMYHTGPVHGTKGRLKNVPLSQLEAFPDPRWRPVPENENFLGVYRFRILK